MGKPDPRIVSAARLQHAKNYPDAEKIYRQILLTEPRHPDALFLLGLLLHQTGKHDLAVDQLRQAVAVQPAQADFRQTLVQALRASGRSAEAISEARTLAQSQPNSGSFQFAVAQLLFETGDAGKALPFARRVLELPAPGPGAFRLLAAVFGKHNQLDAAIDALQTGRTIHPTSAEMHFDLGALLQAQGRFPEAIESFSAGLKFTPQNDVAQNNLGACFILMSRPMEALPCFQAALQLRPDVAEYRNNIGVALLDLGRLDEAIAAFEETRRLHPTYADAPNNLGNCYSTIGEPEKAIAAYRAALVARPSFSAAHSNLLMCLLYPRGSDDRTVFEEHVAFDVAHAQALRDEWKEFDNEVTANRRLRIGYVSPDFREHSIRYFIEPILAAHDRQQFEIFCYASGSRRDEVTERLRAYSSAWHNVAALSDAALADLIRSHRIDILIDLAGHTSDNRLLTFARKPAPVQMTYLGYPTTTGLAAMDYRLTDSITDPPGTGAEFHRERLIRLPTVFFVYGEDRQIPYDSNLPADANGFITFGSFNNFSKINSSMLTSWAKILIAVPNSRLVMKTKALANASTRQRIMQFFTSRGIATGRLDLRAWIPLSDHMRLLGSVDLTLDTFPYNGHTTSCQSLWMGAPFATLAGNNFRSRVGATILHHLNLSELIAKTEADYVRTATELAINLPKLRELRRTLRNRMLESPLMDGKRFTRDLENVFRLMWKDSCESPGENVISSNSV